MSRVYNFSAGPAVLPEEVLQDFGEAFTVATLFQREKFAQIPLRLRHPQSADPRLCPKIITYGSVIVRGQHP